MFAHVFSMTPIFYATCLFAPTCGSHVSSSGVNLALTCCSSTALQDDRLLAWARSHHNTYLQLTKKRTKQVKFTFLELQPTKTQIQPQPAIIMPCITARQARRSMGRRASAIPRSSKGMENLSSVALSAGTEFSLCTHVWSSIESKRSACTQSTSSTSVRSNDYYNSSAESLQAYDMSSLATSLLPTHQQREEPEDSYGFFVDTE